MHHVSQLSLILTPRLKLMQINISHFVLPSISEIFATKKLNSLSRCCVKIIKKIDNAMDVS